MTFDLLEDLLEDLPEDERIVLKTYSYIHISIYIYIRACGFLISTVLIRVGVMSISFYLECNFESGARLSPWVKLITTV